MLDEIVKCVKLLGHSSIKIVNDKVIYVDPFNLSFNYNDADIIFITHSHYDHFSIEDIKKCKKNDTKIVVTKDLYQNSLELGFNSDNIFTVVPNEKYEIDGVTFDTISSYNTNKTFHLKENEWVGYLLNINNIKLFITGDTDINDDNRKVKCDILFLPIGGKYTMNYKEASLLTNEIKPKYVFPIHYGVIVGNENDYFEFEKLINKDIKVKKF